MDKAVLAAEDKMEAAAVALVDRMVPAVAEDRAVLVSQASPVNQANQASPASLVSLHSRQVRPASLASPQPPS